MVQTPLVCWGSKPATACQLAARSQRPRTLPPPPRPTQHETERRIECAPRVDTGVELRPSKVSDHVRPRALREEGRGLQSWCDWSSISHRRLLFLFQIFLFHFRLHASLPIVRLVPSSRRTVCRRGCTPVSGACTSWLHLVETSIISLPTRVKK